MPLYLLEALGALAIAFIAYYTWHEDKLIAFENRIAKAVKERISRYAIQILSTCRLPSGRSTIAAVGNNAVVLERLKPFNHPILLA